MFNPLQPFRDLVQRHGSDLETTEHTARIKPTMDVISTEATQTVILDARFLFICYRFEFPVRQRLRTLDGSCDDCLCGAEKMNDNALVDGQ